MINVLFILYTLVSTIEKAYRVGRDIFFTPLAALGLLLAYRHAIKKAKSGKADVFTNVRQFRSRRPLKAWWFFYHFAMKKEAVALYSDQESLAVIHGDNKGMVYDGANPVSLIDIFPEGEYHLISCFNKSKEYVEGSWEGAKGGLWTFKLPPHTVKMYPCLIMPAKQSDGTTALICVADKWTLKYNLALEAFQHDLGLLTYLNKI